MPVSTGDRAEQTLVKRTLSAIVLEILACTNAECELYGKPNQGNLRVRKIYGRDQIRYLRCTVFKREFGERKGRALWNCKIDEARAIPVAEHLGDGCSFKATVRLVKVDPDPVRRLNRALGQHSQLFHDERAQELVVYCRQADERYGFVTNKRTPCWEAMPTKGWPSSTRQASLCCPMYKEKRTWR
jgi:hypothetical protein